MLNYQFLARQAALYVLFCVILVHIGGCAEDPIMVTASRGDSREVRLLLDQGVNINTPYVFIENEINISGTVLHRAAMMGHLDTVRLLLDRGADPNTRAIAWHEGAPFWKMEYPLVTPLILAATGGWHRDCGFICTWAWKNFKVNGGHIEVVRLLLAWGAIVNDVTLKSASEEPIILHLLEQAAAQLAGSHDASAPVASEKPRSLDINEFIEQARNALKARWTTQQPLLISAERFALPRATLLSIDEQGNCS